MFQLASLRSRVESEGLEFWPLDDNRTHPSELADALQRLGHLSGLSGLRFTISCAAKLAVLVLDSAPAALRAARIDLALVDQNEPAGATVAEFLDIPFLSIAPLPLNREPGIPPPFVPWSYSNTRWARVRNRAGYAIADRVLAPINAVLNARRKQWRLSPIKTPDDSFSRLAQLCMMPLAFDFPRESLPECFHYLGPFLDCERPNGTFSWEKLDGRRLVYASFGTVLGQRRERFYSVATACADVDVQLVLSSGGNDVYLDGLPGSPIVVAHAPQLELLARAQLAITHAGLNTVLEAMHAGVPMVAVPITNDQPAVAARVRHAGLGVTIADNQLSPLRLRKAIQRVLETTEFQGRALHFRQLVKEAGGARRAAEIVEQVLQNGRPVKSGRLPDNALNQPPPPSDVRLSRSRA